MKIVNQLRKAIEETPARSAWKRGVKAYALELIEELPDDQEFYGGLSDLMVLLNGADTWQEYSQGGCSLIYNGDIAERLCDPSKYKRTKQGDNRPNARKNWLDVQARALYQAAALILRLAKE